MKTAEELEAMALDRTNPVRASAALATLAAGARVAEALNALSETLRTHYLAAAPVGDNHEPTVDLKAAA